MKNSFQILSSSQIDSAKWNQRICAQNSDVYNDYHYLNTCTNKNWSGIIWGDYNKVLPIYQKKKWGIIPYICMPLYCQKFDTSHLTVSEFQEVLAYLKKKNFIVDYRVNDFKNQQGFKSKQNFTLDTKSQSFSQIEAKFPSLLRKNILKAAQYLDIDINASKDGVTNFLLENELFVRLNKTSPWIFNFTYGDYIAAKTKGTHEIVAVLFYILYNSKAYLIAPYSSPKGKNMQAMTGLVLHLIQDSKIDIIDFEGSSIDSIARFYEQFGSEKETYYELTYKKFGFL